MRINTKFKLRDIAGETIIVNQGTPEADLTRIISLNTSARLLWNELSDIMQLILMLIRIRW